MKRLSAAINSWTECLLGQQEGADGLSVDTTMDTTPSQSTTTASQFKLGGTPQVEVCTCVTVEWFVLIKMALLLIDSSSRTAHY